MIKQNDQAQALIHKMVYAATLNQLKKEKEKMKLNARKLHIVTLDLAK